MLTIEKITVSQAPFLSTMACEIYKEHYLHLWHPVGAEWYMHEYAYPADILQQELADDNLEYYIVYEEGNPLGYLKLVLNASLLFDSTANVMEIERIYLYRHATGKGIGGQLLQWTMQRAAQLKKQLVFLKAMDSSIAAINFYRKAGFQICGTMQLPMPLFALMQEKYRGMVILKKVVV